LGIEGVDMAKVEASVMIDRSSAEVWKFMTDLSNFPKWNPDVLEARQTSEAPLGVGTTLFVRSPRTALNARVIEYEKNRKFSFESTSGPIQGTTTTFGMETIEGKTRLTRVIDLRLIGFYKLIGPIAARRARRKVSAQLGNIRRLLESEAGS